MSKIVITGAGGFIGGAAAAAFSHAGFTVCPILRTGSAADNLPAGVRAVYLPDLGADAAKLAEIFSGAAMVVHLADNPQRSQTGATGSQMLARVVADAAALAGVPRTVFASSIYAAPHMQGAANSYGAGKRAAESVFQQTGAFATVCLRLPPVYGPGSKGAITLLSSLIRRGIPVPFGMARAERDYLAIDNLMQILIGLARADDTKFAALAAKIWEPCDGAPISTRELVKLIGAALGRPARLVPVPQWMLSMPAALVGKKDQIDAAFAPLRCRDGAELARQLAPQFAPQQNCEICCDMAQNLAYLGQAAI